MAQFIVRNVDDDVKARLQQRARSRGTSLEEEVRSILRNAVKGGGMAPRKLGSRIAARFARIGLESELPELRGEPVRVPDFRK